MDNEAKKSYKDFNEMLKDALTEWSKAAGVHFGYNYDFNCNELHIYCTRPGLLIGDLGELIKKYRPQLSFVIGRTPVIIHHEIDGVI